MIGFRWTELSLKIQARKCIRQQVEKAGPAKLRYNHAMIQVLTLAFAFSTLLLAAWLLLQLRASSDTQRELAGLLEEKHRALLMDLHNATDKLGDRLSNASAESSERLRGAVAQELKATRDAMQALQLSQTESLGATREQVLEKLHLTLAEQGKAEQELIQGTMRNATQQLIASIESLA